MVRLLFILSILSTCVTTVIKAQSFFIEGKVLDAATKESIPYASNYSLKRLTWAGMNRK